MKRTCPKCDNHLELNAENFPKDKTKPHGFSYACKPCSRKRYRIAWTSKTKEEKKEHYQTYNQRKLKWGRDYYKTENGRARILVSSYKKIDGKKGHISDLDSDFIQENIINKPCFYCGTVSEPIGCDRINNNMGHIKSNVVPCCKSCNLTRGDRFTHEEMVILGDTICQIKKTKKSEKVK